MPFVHYAYPKPPNLWEKFLWRIPKYGFKRRLQFISKYFTLVIFVELLRYKCENACYKEHSISNLYKLLLICKFNEVEDILLQNLECDRKQIILSETHRFMSKQLTRYDIEDEHE